MGFQMVVYDGLCLDGFVGIKMIEIFLNGI